MWESAIYNYKKHYILGVGRDNSPKYILKYLTKYKKYDRLKNDVDNLKKELLNIKKIRNEFLVKIEEVKSLIEKAGTNRSGFFIS